MASRSNRLSLHATLCLGVAAIAMAQPNIARAQAQPAAQVDIPAQALSVTLTQIGRQTNAEIIFSAVDVRGKSAAAVKGNYSTAQALELALRGSTLTVRKTPQGAYLVEPGAEQSDSEGVRAGSVAVESESAEADDIVVTATRLGRPDVPTPLLQLNTETLRTTAPPNLIAALNDLPQFRGAVSAQTRGSSTDSGAYSIDLRGLAPVRTLALFDGVRIVSNYTAPDVAIIPSILVKRVDIVTGGASAAWGSNAVAGVVNFVIDDKLDGLRVGAKAGISGRGDVGERHIEAAFGTEFANGRARLIVGGEYTDIDGGGVRTSRKNVGRWATVPNATAGQAPLIIAPDVGIANVSPGGLILTGINAGRAFNSDGTLRPFDLGRVSGTNSIGGEAPANDDVAQLSSPATRYSVMGRFTYDLTDSIKLSADLWHAQVSSDYPFLPDPSRGDITIQAANPFLPAAIRDQMVAAGEASFQMGRFNADFATIGIDYRRRTTQATLRLDGALAANVNWQAYFTHGTFTDHVNLSNQRIRGNFANAVDVVTNPGTGQPICRVTLTNPASGCIPINLFGEGAPSQQARDYVLGTATQRNKITLDAGGLTLRGDPVTLWAGPVSAAIGVEARRETIQAVNGALDRLGALTLVNFPAYSGHNTTKEAFAEVQIPLIRDVPLLKLLQLNGAARLTHDQSGSIWAWKLGVINELVPGVQVRATRSRDIRAANLSELYINRIGPTLSTVSDPFTGTTRQIFGFSGGNPNLNPEYANTTTAGISFNHGGSAPLNVSIDYFDINVKDAISVLPAQSIVNLCFTQNQLCDAIERGPDGAITTVSATNQNFLSFKARGFDAALSYTLPIALPGSLRIQSNATWMTKYNTDNGLVKINYLESQGIVGAPGLPKIRANVAAYYTQDSFQAHIRGRYISSGLFNRNQDIQNNRIPEYVYLDLGVQLNVYKQNSSEFQIYGVINNVLDKDPPPGSVASPFYDVVGRYFAVGVRAKF